MSVLLSEWTKLRSVLRWVITLLGAALLTVGLSFLGSRGSSTDINEHRNFVVGPHGDPVADSFYFVHQPVTGDTTLTVHVASLTQHQPPEVLTTATQTLRRLNDPSPFAGAAAGIMIKDGAQSGSSYASVLLSDKHGVRMQSDYSKDVRGSASSGSRWLRLVRAGGTVTGYESGDGTTWRKIASVTPKTLPATAEVGFYVSAAETIYWARGGGGSTAGGRTAQAEATFDNVVLNGASQWKGDQLGAVDRSPKNGALPEIGGFTSSGGSYTVTGMGKVGPNAPDDDVMEAALVGVIAGLMALISVGVLFATSEYRRGMIRATFAATPRRGQVLAAKAIVLFLSAYAVSLIAVVAALELAIPGLRKGGYAPPAFPKLSLLDGPVVRALLLSAAFMALVSVFAMAVGIVMKRSAAAITVSIVLVLLPVIAGSVIPGTAPRWLMYASLAGGLATQRAKPPTILLADPWAMISPWAGIGVVAAYAAAALGLAWWRLRQRDA
jgi:hypothetical protein